MTNEEAIEEFENTIDLIKQNGKDWLDERDIPILESAIKALKLEQSIKTDDRFKECKKDWTKCGRCPVTMEWIKEQKVRNKDVKNKLG